MQAHAEFAEQGEGQALVGFQQAHVGRVGEAVDLRRAHRLRRGDVVGCVHQHHGFGEGLPVADDLEDLLLTIRRQAVDLDGAGNHEVERMRRLALQEQVVALVEIEQLAGIHQLVHLFVVQRLEQVVAAKNLVMYAMKHHARHS
ncbi:hypothetical protein D3C77_524840 [compost metagenome]